MNRNNRFIVSVAVIAAILLYIIISHKGKRSGEIPDLRQLKKVDEIIISKNDKQIKLYKREGKWFVNEGFPADKSKVEALEKEMKDLTITDYISKGQYYQKYDLEPEKAIKVTLKMGGDIKREVLIGKTSSTFKNTYIKFANDSKIYLANGNLNDEFRKDADEFRDKEIYKIDQPDVGFIEINYRSKISFEKQIIEAAAESKDSRKEKAKDKQKDIKQNKIDKWICKQFPNVEIDNSKMSSFTGAFSELRADSFPAINKKDISGFICSVKGKAGAKEISFIIHKKDGEMYICTSSESPYVFGIREWSAKRFFKDLNDFKANKK